MKKEGDYTSIKNLEKHLELLNKLDKNSYKKVNEKHKKSIYWKVLAISIMLVFFIIGGIVLLFNNIFWIVLLGVFMIVVPSFGLIRLIKLIKNKNWIIIDLWWYDTTCLSSS